MAAHKIVRPLIAGATVAVAALGLTAALAPASAAPGPSGANLHIIEDPDNQGNYLLAILGRFPMPQADAVGFLNNINNGDCQGGMNYYIFGDDEGDPDRYIHFKPAVGVHDDNQGLPESYLPGPGVPNPDPASGELAERGQRGVRRQR